jgi:lariat debranching enzyme
MRTPKDLDAMNCPEKFKRMGDFEKYFRGEKTAPYLTLFIGGNHEASDYLRQLYYGGYTAKNIYFMGYSGVVKVRKGETEVRIAAISGIEKEYDSQRGYFEEHPYTHNPKNLRSMYHIREFEVEKMALLKTQVDIMVSHEWPTLVTN